MICCARPSPDGVSRPAMDFLGRRWSYAQLGDLVDRATRGLQDMGVGPGSKVGLCLPNTPYYVVFFYAVLRAGGTVVNFNPLYVERELDVPDRGLGHHDHGRARPGGGLSQGRQRGGGGGPDAAGGLPDGAASSRRRRPPCSAC